MTYQNQILRNKLTQTLLSACVLFLAGCAYNSTTPVTQTTVDEAGTSESVSADDSRSSVTAATETQAMSAHQHATAKSTTGPRRVERVAGMTANESQKLLAEVDCSVINRELLDPPTLEATGRVLSTRLFAADAYKCINGKRVVLQSYFDAQAGTDRRPVGPAYIMHVAPQNPNPQLNILFRNALGPANGDYDCDDHAGDVSKCTNLHTHGFHVSPKPGSDDVFLHLSPADPAFQYRFDIPNTHAPGTHWLHAHLHGSTAPQVKNGMAGALILKGEIDRRLAADYGIGGNKEKIIILQQLEGSDDQPLCVDPVGVQLQTSINGQCLPFLNTQAGDVFRWRLIHAGVSATVNFAINDAAGESVTLREFARDGITMQRAIDEENILLQPGYRSDILFKVPACPRNQYPCTLNVVDAKTIAQNSLYGVSEVKEVIARIIVTGLASSQMRLPPTDWIQFKSPYKFIPDSELLKDANGNPVEQKISFASINGKQTVNGEVFPYGGTTKLKLKTATLWKIWVGKEQTTTASHPFHIHVNPFQVTQSYPNRPDFHYWKDTLLIPYTGDDPKVVTVRSRYETFDGRFVLHCHNLNHEDGGMMRTVEIHE